MWVKSHAVRTEDITLSQPCSWDPRQWQTGSPDTFPWCVPKASSPRPYRRNSRILPPTSRQACAARHSCSCSFPRLVSCRWTLYYFWLFSWVVLSITCPAAIQPRRYLKNYLGRTIVSIKTSQGISVLRNQGILCLDNLVHPLFEIYTLVYSQQMSIPHHLY